MFLSEQQERRQMRKLKADAMERRDESNRVPLPGRAGN
jgi:hypothetical protein